MKGRSGQLAVAVAACVLLIMLPFAGFLENNYGDPSFNPNEFLRFASINIVAIAAVVIMVGLVIWLACRRRMAVLEGFLIASGVVFYLLFTYEPLVTWLGIPVRPSTGAALHVALILVVGAAVWSLAKHRVVGFAITAFAAANFVSFIPALSEVGMVWSQVDSREQVRINNHGVNDLPNIYYIILDAYPSASSLKNNFRFDNTNFISEMERNGFYHAADVRSSYNLTSFTLTSIMLGDYAVDLLKLGNEQTADRRYPRLLSGTTPPPTVAAAQKLGYDFFVVGNQWGPCAGPHAFCYEDGGKRSYIAETFWSATPAIALLNSLSRKLDRKTDVDALGKVIKHLKENGLPSAPTFTFVHHLSPHPPYIFKPDCEVRESYEFDFKGWSEDARAYFLDNLACTNRKALELVDMILLSDPDAIIVLQGDHGSAFTVPWDVPFEEWPQSAIRERSSILNLIRLPGRCESSLHPQIDNVNTIRAVLSCVGAAMHPGKVRSFIGTYSKHGPDAGTIREINPETDQLLPIR